MRRILPLVVSILFLAPQLHAADLTKIERTIRKEPAYQSKTPRYCLLVFGPEAKTRVWLVLDGKTLYVDRNGNGDLTEDGEKVSGTKEVQTILEDDVYRFEVGELRDGDRRHRNVTLIATGLRSASESKTVESSKPHSLSFRIRMEAEFPGFEGVTKDGRVLQRAYSNGSLQFADKLREAPILHFAGPLMVIVDSRATFRVNREMEMYFALGTPGQGEGTFVYTAYEGAVPPSAYPRAEIAFPAQKPGEPPVKAIYELKGRC